MPKNLYRISFFNQDAIYEIYAKTLKDSELFGFIEVEELVFGEQSAVVVDPSEERLKLEFNGVKRIFIPMQAVVRIDEVTHRGTAKVRDKIGTDNKITQFPGSGKMRD